MPVFSVDTQAVADASLRTRNRAATIASEVDALSADIAALQSSWMGSASASMAACASDWHVTQAHVQASLDMLCTALDRAAMSYTDAEAANASLFAH